MTSVELCPKCHTLIALTSYKPPFHEPLSRAYQNPIQSEVACIKSSLESASAEFAIVAQEIERVESLLNVLKAHRAHLDTYIERSTQYIRPSPIRRLPTEVLAIIFAIACTSFQRNEYKTPLSISLVCSKWREMALSTHSLWTNIHIAPYSGSPDVYKYFLEQSGNIPISLKVEIPYKTRPQPDDHRGLVPYEDTYHYHVHFLSDTWRLDFARWKTAELCMTAEDVSFLLRSRERPPEFPLLESLTLVNEGPVTALEAGLFTRSPLLTSVTISDRNAFCLADFDDYVPALPRRQLLEICTDNGYAPQSNQLFVSNTLDDNHGTFVLRSRCYDIYYSPCMTINGFPFVLSISTLVLDVAWTSSLLSFFRDVDIPTLESLTMMPPNPRALQYIQPAYWIDPFHALSKLASSCKELQTFTVFMRGRYGDDIDVLLEDSLVDALHNMPGLQALRIIEAESGPSLFNERLFKEMTDSQLVPALTSLELVWAEDRQPVDGLIPMLSLRCGQGGGGMNTLSSVILGVRNGGDLRGDVLDCVANLRQQGIRATLG